MDNKKAFQSCLAEVLPAVMEPQVKNKLRDQLVAKEVLRDIRGERELTGETRTFQNDSGDVITERFNGDSVTYRKTLSPDGSYVLEYFDDQGVLARKLKFCRDGGVDEDRFKADGTWLSSVDYPTVEFWKEAMVNGGIFPFVLSSK